MSLLKRSHNSPSGRPHSRGQAFVELVLVLPILLLLIAGMVEVVFSFNDYLQMLDGARNGARDSADLNPYPNNAAAYLADPDCATTKHFFQRTGCSTSVFLKPVDVTFEGYGATAPGGTPCIDMATEPENFTSDIVISIFTTAVVGPSGSQTFEVRRFDNIDWNTGSPKLVRDDAIEGDEVADSGWSYIHDRGPTAGQPNARGMCSNFKTDTHIRPLLLGNSGVASAAPNTGYLIVEVFYRHYQLFDAPLFGDIIPNPIPLHAYAIFSLSAAEATPTPEP